MKKERRITLDNGWYALDHNFNATIIVQFMNSVTASGYDIEDYVKIGYTYRPVRVIESPQMTHDIGLCAAAVVLAYHRKTHEHILRDDETVEAARRVEQFLKRR